MATWYDVTREISAMVREDYENDGFSDIHNDDDMQEYAHEWADGSQNVIYYHRARELWADSATVQGYESDAWDLMGDEKDIDKVIALCVYLAMRDEIMSAVQELREEVTA